MLATPETSPSLTLPWLIGIVAGSSGIFALFTAIFGKVADFWMDRRKGFALAAHSSLRVALTLELYSHACASLLSSIEGFEFDDDYPEAVPVERLPNFPGYPKEVDWMPINARLASEALSLESRIPLLNARLAELYASEEPSIGYSAFERFCSRTGLAAWLSARRLRARYKLPAISASELPWRYPQFLRDHVRHNSPGYLKSRRRRRAVVRPFRRVYFRVLRWVDNIRLRKKINSA